MALSQAQLSKYGLTKTDASAIDKDKGIVSHGDTFYQIEGFQHGQEDRLDQDKGKVFSSSLAADAAAKGFNPTTFNTAGDVQNAINTLDAGVEEAADPDPVELSERAAKGLAGVESYETFMRGVGKSGYGNETDLIFGSPDEQKAANQSFADTYKANLKKHLTPGKASGYAGAGEMTEKDDGPSDIAKKIIGDAKKKL